MTTIKCNCQKCIQNDNEHWWCQRFADFTYRENVELCKQYPLYVSDNNDLDDEKGNNRVNRDEAANQ